MQCHHLSFILFCAITSLSYSVLTISLISVNVDAFSVFQCVQCLWFVSSTYMTTPEVEKLSSWIFTLHLSSTSICILGIKFYMYFLWLYLFWTHLSNTAKLLPPRSGPHQETFIQLTYHTWMVCSCLPDVSQEQSRYTRGGPNLGHRSICSGGLGLTQTY